MYQTAKFFKVDVGSGNGNIQLLYDMYSTPDQLDLIYEENVIFTTENPVFHRGNITRTIGGNATYILVNITTNLTNSRWDFSVSCISHAT